ncbi:hypothetical protein ACIQ57_16975 [Lysinibacillus xylanilyticus]|uniref:hypothetical protein n=1 Tax=Lysinibacillus xylanilyticus TaxID=582475 RepID=UPI0037FD903A
MSFELNILVVNQNKPLPIPFPSFIEVINEVDDKMVLRLDCTWKFMRIESEKLPIPFWIDDEDVIYNLTPLVFHKEYLEEFEAILEFLIKQSPTNTLMLLARYQGGDYEIIQGTISRSNFIHH